MRGDVVPFERNRAQAARQRQTIASERDLEARVTSARHALRRPRRVAVLALAIRRRSRSRRGGRSVLVRPWNGVRHASCRERRRGDTRSGHGHDRALPGTSGDVAVSVVNDNTYRVYVGSLVLDTAQGTGGFSVTGGQPGCDVAALSYTAQSNSGAGWFVPAGSTLDLDLPNAIALDTTAASACQGATFVVYLVAAT